MVPFGRQKKVGLILEIVNESDLPKSKLRQCINIIDQDPVFSESDLWIISFASKYYQHPIGRVIAAALPTYLKKDRPAISLVEEIQITKKGNEIIPDEIKKRAPKQAQLISYLQKKQSITVDILNKKTIEWKSQRRSLLKKEWITISHVPSKLNTQRSISIPIKGPALNSEQKIAVNKINETQYFKPFLLYGITGSGKTEVYLRVILEVLKTGKQCLILVPEIGLTTQFIERVIQRIGIEPVLLHSSLTEHQRFKAWQMTRNPQTKLILGTRSAIFAPIHNLGIIIVDEENDISYKQQDGFRYSARDLAVTKAKYFDIPIILGSATPSLESLNLIKQKKYTELTLQKRAGNAQLPSMHLVDMTKGYAPDGLSPSLIKTIKKHLKKDGQILIYINRRGFAPTLICTSCNHIAQCLRCDSRMTVYLSQNKLACHHCGSYREYTEKCIICNGEYKALGQGTQRLEEVLGKYFPNIMIKRIDSDSTRLKGTMDEALNIANTGKARILVGTQMLSKGHHFPSLTLVAVINADQGLFSNDFRGSERLAQSLIQVSGRAGREDQKGQVIIQTEYPDHPFWEALFEGGYKRVAEHTLQEREAASWPPFSYLALIRVSSHKKDFTWEFLNSAHQIIEKDKLNDINIMGPVSAPMERKAGKYRGQLLLHCENRKSLHQQISLFIKKIERKKCTHRVKWSVDIDPIELF